MLDYSQWAKAIKTYDEYRENLELQMTYRKLQLLGPSYVDVSRRHSDDEIKLIQNDKRLGELEYLLDQTDRQRTYVKQYGELPDDLVITVEEDNLNA